MDLSEAFNGHKFQIGDLVRHVTDRRAERIFVVVEKGINQCHGGIQRGYQCSTIGTLLDRERGHIRFNFNETELAKVDSTDDPWKRENEVVAETGMAGEKIRCARLGERITAMPF